MLAAAISERGQDLTWPGTVATRIESGWRIDGRKLFCTMCPAATDLYVAVTYVDGEGVGRYGYAMVRTDAPGVVVHEDWDALGMRAIARRDLECEIDAEHHAGDHWIVVGRVDDLRVAPIDDPLIFFAGAFRRCGDERRSGEHESPVERRALLEPAPERLDQPLELGLVEVLAVTRTGGPRDVLVHQRAAGVVIPACSGCARPPMPSLTQDAWILSIRPW